jgi:hypothetical protein
MKFPLDIGIINTEESLLRKKSRRKMAWISLYSILGLTLILLFAISETKIAALSSIVDTVFFCLSSIVLGYLGAGVMDNSNNMKHVENMHKKEPCNDKKKDIKIDNPDEEK